MSENRKEETCKLNTGCTLAFSRFPLQLSNHLLTSVSQRKYDGFPIILAEEKKGEMHMLQIK